MSLSEVGGLNKKIKLHQSPTYNSEMNNWNYRVIKHTHENGQVEFGIYEVFYFDDGSVKGWTKEPLTPTSPSLAELKEDLNLMVAACEAEPLHF